MRSRGIVRHPLETDYDAFSDDTACVCPPGEDMAQQQFGQEADINVLVRRFGLGGEVPVARVPAEYGDFSQVTDFKTAMDQVVRGQQAFAELPAKVRDRFNNDPRQFWEYLHTEENLPELVELGLVPQKVLDDVVAARAAAAGEAAS